MRKVCKELVSDRKKYGIPDNQFPILVIDDVVNAATGPEAETIIKRLVVLARNLAPDDKICNVFITASNDASVYVSIRSSYNKKKHFFHI